ncbi:MAG: adenosylmethionine--8-amino-7-oxononanoate transaminase [Steroidobacteraceae bacterium]
MPSPVRPAPPRSLAERDLRVVWHPCTQMKDHEWLPMVPIARGSGAWLYDHDGRRYLDAISSWWVNLFGHANPRINAAITAQMARLEHVILAGFTHEPAVALAERLTALAPTGLTRCFYADNGSSAIEVALKMSYHAWRNLGRSRKKRFITLANSYHGETLGALAVGNVELYKEIYQPLLMDVVTAPSPDAYEGQPGETAAEVARRAIDAMRALLEQHGEETCAVIVEPLVQCAAGMRMHSPLYLQLLRELCDRHEVHLIADEIAVGFGRTGTMFACEQAGITPDFLCLSKGITGGYLPLSVVLAGERVYEAFYDEYSRLRAFLHSHSYTGNALACTAALATLDIFESDAVLERNRGLARHLGHAACEMLGGLPHVAEVRQSGMIVAAELAQDGDRRTPFDWRERRGLRVYQHDLAHEALLRPIGNVVYFMPPYVVTPQEIDALVATARDGIIAATGSATMVAVPGSRDDAPATARVPTASTTGLEF